MGHLKWLHKLKWYALVKLWLCVFRQKLQLSPYNGDSRRRPHDAGQELNWEPFHPFLPD